MTHRQAEKSARTVIADLLIQIQLQIQERATLRKVPLFLASSTWKLAIQNIVAVMPESGKPLRNAFQEQLLAEVPKLEKDTLMPKDVSGQKVRVNSPERLSPRSSCSSARKSIRMSKLNSIKLTDKLKSISMIEKKGSGRERSKKEQICSQLDIKLNEETEDQEFERLREKTDYRLQCLEEQARLKQQREQYYQQQLKKFNQTIADNTTSNVTFDYDGDPMRRTLMDEELRMYTMKASLGNSKRKMRDGYSKLNAPQLSKIQVSKKQRERAESSRALRPLDIPTFYMKNIESYEVSKMKKEQYKKKFGRGYSRLGNQTLYNTATNQKNINDLQSEGHTGKEKADKADTERIDNTQKIDVNRASRRLALPRLHGKYKVLDRYQDN